MNENDIKNIETVKSSGVYNWLKNNITMRLLTNFFIFATPVILIYIYVTFNPSEIKETLKDNKKIETKIDSLKTDNAFIMERMYELEKKQTLFFDMINQNNDLIKENNKELLKLKKIYYEKINSINGYSVSQLDSFFTSRYKEYYNK